MEEVQKIIHLLTTEISRQDSRFEAVPVSDTHNESIKVSGALPVGRALGSTQDPGQEGLHATESLVLPQVSTDALPGTVYTPP